MYPNLALYKLPTTLDIPNVQAAIVEQPSVIGPYGVKGVGEPPVVASAAAVANAVFDATGVQITQTPLTPERVFRAMHHEAEERTVGIGIDVGGNKTDDGVMDGMPGR